MILKKISVFLLAVAFVFALPTSPTNAGAGEWDLVGQKTFQWDSFYYTYSTRHSIVYSGGGNFRVCRTGGALNTYITFSLWEQDSSSGRDDDFVTSFRLAPGQCGTVNVAKFVDGTNKKAEFYVVSTSNQSKATFWD